MSWNNITPLWAISMPYDKWEKGEITDDQMWKWLTDKNNHVPAPVIDNWRKVLNKEIA